ncbi:MAG TPA: carboxypeptidase-like regulatory domain-containing protein [Pyrinomonadaceae bacterium]|nr:carboxypeptidase-like regulatory domain-containing protein [Pyrinomonadaceae bacterium]
MAVACMLSTVRIARMQDTVTGAFEGTVTNSETGAIIVAATVQIINGQTGQTISKTTDSRGRFYQGLLSPGVYTIRVSAVGFATREVRQRLFITRTGEVVPVPVALDPAQPVAAAASPTPAALPLNEETTDIRARINATDGQRGGAFTEEEVSTLPLGATTFVRTFDELTFLLPGVAPPPQTLGSVAGPGVGAGVGSSGQFSVNGLRSRANNFTVDGSDNNDEDIGVRRQGFVSLTSQPIESIKEYQAITLLAPAQFGRNIGAQVNAVSKSGGNETHGTIYGFLNTSQLNARNFFDTAFGNAVSQLRAGDNQAVLLAEDIRLDNARVIPVNPRPLTVRNESGGEDSFTFWQGGFVLGGPVKRERVFYFVSAERQQTNATKEESFAVPTVEQRGAFGSGATGLFLNPFRRRGVNDIIFDPVLTQPTTRGGDAVFSLFPFPNNPQGIYGKNTLTQSLRAGGHGTVLSAKVDGNFKIKGRQQSLTNRYNFTQDERVIPVTSNAIFSSLKPRVRTQNNSLFFNSELTAPDSARPAYNQVRLSYGRTRLVFDEARDTTFLSPSYPSGVPFVLNAPLIGNQTRPELRMGDNQQISIQKNSGPIIYTPLPCPPLPPGVTIPASSVECELGPVGQVNIAGFNPVGVDVFDFPQRRVNNTYQVADSLTWRVGAHSLGFGTDLRRTELNSALERNARALITFGGAPTIDIDIDPATGKLNGISPSPGFIRPETLAAASAASGFTQTFSRNGESGLNLRFYQLDFYAQDSWRVRPSLSLSFGLRYEYNTPPRETSRRIEDSFNDPSLALIPGLSTFIGNRTGIFDPDRNNFAPRLGIAYAPNLFGRDRLTVIRGGYGIFYDQILGAVVSQSRSVYPNNLTFDRAGGNSNRRFVGDCPEGNTRNNCGFELIPPFFTGMTTRNDNGAPSSFVPLVLPGTLNTLNPAFSFNQLVGLVNGFGTGGGILPPINGFAFTIPQQQLEMPMAHHYSVSFEQQLGRGLVASAAYAGTLGRHLLRFTTPNLGRNSYLAPALFTGGGLVDNRPIVGDPAFYGFALPPGTRIAQDGRGFIGGRPVQGVGAVIRYETTAESRYDSLQLQLRGRLRRSLQFQMAYTFSKATDDVSDTFDLAGAPALPQNSFTFAGERARANYDVPHRFTYNFVYDLPGFVDSSRAIRFLLGGLQLAGTGQLRSGQPFTVNSIFDVNLDGNLTDRLDTTKGLTITGDRRQPLRLDAPDPSLLLARFTKDGRIGRNTFRAGNVIELDLSATKRFALGERQSLLLRVDVFNFINRANFGVPVRFLEAPAFGQATSTITPPRRVQIALKYSF